MNTPTLGVRAQVNKLPTLGTLIASAALFPALGACGSDSNGGSKGGLSGLGGNIQFLVPDGSASGGLTGAGGAYSLPQGFTPTEHGGYKLGDPIMAGTDAGAAGSSNGCNGILGVVRDFKGTCDTKNDKTCTFEPNGHPDFETFSGDRETTGLVPVDLGVDSKPGYTGICEASTTGNCPYGQQTTTQANFDQWYRYAAGVNQPYTVYFSLEPNGAIVTFQSDLFFPLDNAGWGNSGTGEDDKPHNFGFTTEVHTEFRYDGGETFTFIGDDDVWVFINKKLAVDLGGLHPSRTGSIDLDARAGQLGITKGNTYPLDLFHAERHTNASHFRIDTNLAFTNCGTIIPDGPIR